jgi:hypothetical protein
VIAGVSIVCAVGPWLFTESLVLRGLAAAAAVTTVVGAVVMRSWDVAAGKRVADLTRARASDEWQHEERVAELETDLEESRELRTKLEHKLRAKRTELANLRNEHAALLRRYATAETERASALEGRRLLAIETAPPARELPAANADRPRVQETPDADEDAGGRDHEEAAVPVAAGPGEAAEDDPSAERVFSPEGSALFMRADSALARLTKDDDAARQDADPAGEGDAERENASEAAASTEDGDPAQSSADSDGTDATGTPDNAPRGDAGKTPSGKTSPRPGKGGPGNGGGKRRSAEPAAPEGAAGNGGSSAGDEPGGQPTAVAGQEHAAAPAAQQPQSPVTKPAHATGHFTVPTAVAVAPQTPRRRPTVEGGFDFFGTQKSHEAMESVQNEDLADVVGQEALAVHKAESESGFKPMDPQAHGVGQVIDLTAHDETEQIDIQGLRTAAS